MNFSALRCDDATPAIFRPRALLWTLAALTAIIVFFEITDFDLPVQDLFFDFVSKTWILPAPADSWFVNVFFYNGPKIFVIVLAVLILLLALLPEKIRAHLPENFSRLARANLIVVVLTVSTAPALIGFIKKQTNVHYPCNIERYGGTVPYVRLFEKFTPEQRPAKRSAGFPAGHSSGGFALISLACLAATRRRQIVGALIGVSLGWWMGLYQMLRGVHYLSHTIVSMLICQAVFLLCYYFVHAVRRKFFPAKNA